MPPPPQPAAARASSRWSSLAGEPPCSPVRLAPRFPSAGRPSRPRRLAASVGIVCRPSPLPPIAGTTLAGQVRASPDAHGRHHAGKAVMLSACRSLMRSRLRLDCVPASLSSPAGRRGLEKRIVKREGGRAQSGGVRVRGYFPLPCWATKASTTSTIFCCCRRGKVETSSKT